MNPYPIRTKRLLLRRPRLSDAAEIVPLLNDRLIARFTLVPHPYAKRDWTKWVRKNAGPPPQRPEGLSYPFVIEMDGRIVAMVGLRWDAEERAGNIGYWVGRRYRRQGIATEAARGLTDYCFRTLKAERVWATVLGGNVASPPVLKACGMKYEGTLRSHQLHRGRRVDVEHYSVIRSEWKRRQRK